MKNFNNNWSIAGKLSGININSLEYNTLKSIYTNTERSWKKETLGNNLNVVKYLLICEAPPYSNTNPPIYFYNQKRRLLSTVWKTFFPNQPIPQNVSLIYKALAEIGFLLIDSLPYALNYSAKKTRYKSGYQTLVCNLINWWMTKVASNFKIDPDVKVAFGFKLNAKAIMKCLPISNGKRTINLNGISIQVDDSNIAADGSGFPNAKKLRKIFGLP